MLRASQTILHGLLSQSLVVARHPKSNQTVLSQRISVSQPWKLDAELICQPIGCAFACTVDYQTNASCYPLSGHITWSSTSGKPILNVHQLLIFVSLRTFDGLSKSPRVSKNGSKFHKSTLSTSSRLMTHPLLLVRNHRLGSNRNANEPLLQLLLH